MISGYIERNQATLPITLHLADGKKITIDFVVDTGFAGDLTLPPEAVTSLGLRYFQTIFANLANDSSVPVNSYAARIDWAGATRDVHILATGSRPLLGTALLAGHEFVAQFVPNGLVTVDAV